jgi:hypothetical protein
MEMKTKNPHGAVASGYDERNPSAPWYVITSAGQWNFTTKTARDEARDFFIKENKASFDPNEEEIDDSEEWEDEDEDWEDDSEDEDYDEEWEDSDWGDL